MLEEKATLLKGTERLQVAGSKYKEITSRNKERYWLFKKAKGKKPEKYYGGATVKIRVLTPVRGI